MNTRVCDSRILRLVPGFIAAVILCVWASPGAQAQHFYDHDRQWKHGSMGDGGMVPDDYLVPMPVGEITCSSPPMGYRVSKSQLQQQQYAAPMFVGDYSAAWPQHYSRGKSKPAATGGGAKSHDDAADWLSGAGGSGYGNMAVSESEHNRLKSLQAQAARRKQDAAARERAEMFSRSTVDSGGLIRGIGELK